MRDELYRNFWEIFVSKCREQNNVFSQRNTTKGDYLQISLNHSKIKLSCEARQIACRVVITLQDTDEQTNKLHFNQLNEHKDEIENQLGYSLKWEIKEGQQQSRITYEKNRYDINNKQDWKNIHEFFIKTTQEFIDVFTPYIENLD